MKFQRLRGFEDLLPEEMRWRQAFLRRVEEIFAAHDIHWITTPTLERTELFERSIGEATDIVEKEMFTFQDRGGRRVTLRPEGTAPVVRAFLEHQMQPPLRLGYFINNFRAERPQKGRLREFWQVGVEFLGYAHPASDVLLIQIATEILEAAGVSTWRLELHTLGTPEERSRFREALRTYFTGKDLCADCKHRLERNPLRVLDCKVDAPRMTDTPRLVDFLSDESRRFYEEVKEGLARLGIPFEENSRLVRGLDYYTHTVFEFKAEGLGAQDAVGGGGRYDGLVAFLGGPDVPASGFAMGVERLHLASSLTPPDLPPLILILAVDPADLPEVLSLERELAGKGPWRVHLYPEIRSLKTRMRLANRLGARLVLIVGEEERKNQVVRLRDMAGHEEYTVPREQLLEVLRKHLGEVP